jgi:hypothetical protein
MRGDVLRHMVAHMLGSIPHTQRERCHGVVHHDARGNGVTSGQLRSHIGQRVDGAATLARTVEVTMWRDHKVALLLTVDTQALQHVIDDGDAAGPHR